MKEVNKGRNGGGDPRGVEGREKKGRKGGDLELNRGNNSGGQRDYVKPNPGNPTSRSFTHPAKQTPHTRRTLPCTGTSEIKLYQPPGLTYLNPICHRTRAILAHTRFICRSRPSLGGELR